MSELREVPVDEHMVRAAERQAHALEALQGVIIAAALEHEADLLESMTEAPAVTGGEYLRMRAAAYRATPAHPGALPQRPEYPDVPPASMDECRDCDPPATLQEPERPGYPPSAPQAERDWFEGTS